MGCFSSYRFVILPHLLQAAVSTVSTEVFSADKKHHWAHEAKSNSDGLVRIELTSKGLWRFATAHKTPYPDKSECDDYSYRISLTVSF